MKTQTQQVEVKQPNWLPLPCEEIASVEEGPFVDENDLFSKGEISCFYPQQGYGYVKNMRNETFIFRLSETNLVGPKNDSKYISTGSRVGYDISWTSSGPHISRLKVY